MRSLLVLTSLIAIGCQSGTDSSSSTQQPEQAVDLSEWRSELIALPPGFAPGMPEGREVISFAPGWSTPGAEDFWSYVLLMEVEGMDSGPRPLEEMFELYFDGLIGAVGSGKPFDLPADPATVSIQHEGGTRYTGVVDTYDAFGDGAPLKLHLTVDATPLNSTSSQLRVIASPRTSDHEPVWHPLRAALRSLSFE